MEKDINLGFKIGFADWQCSRNEFYPITERGREVLLNSREVIR